MTMYLPARILVAPSGFKESLSAVEVAESIAAGVRRVLPGVRVDLFPVPDGGEGTVEILAQRPGAITHTTRVTGPVGQPVQARWLEFPESSLAVVEMASAAGLSLVPRDLRDPTATSTYGVGELMLAALDRGAKRIIVGCGDSGTSDGGAGALAALGAVLFDANGCALEPEDINGAALASLSGIDPAGLHPRLSEVQIELACNIHNVLTGPRGVAEVFGPQKGATPEQVTSLSKGLAAWADLLEETFAPDADLHLGAGSGASGGLGAGLMAVGAAARDRFDVLLGDTSELDDLMDRADLVITAEGAIDFQTPRGKVPAEIAQRAQRSGVPVLAIAGSLGKGAPQVHDVGIGAIASIMTVPMALEDAVRDGRALLTDAAERTIRLLLLGSAVSGRRAEMLSQRAGLAVLG